MNMKHEISSKYGLVSLRRGIMMMIVLLGAVFVFSGTSYAQTNAELQAAIDKGPGAIKAFYTKYADKPDNLADLDVTLVSDSLRDENGGLDNMLTTMSDKQVDDYMKAVVYGPSADKVAADFASGLIYSLVDKGEDGVLKGLPPEVLAEIEKLSPGTLKLLTDNVPELFTKFIDPKAVADLLAKLDPKAAGELKDLLTKFGLIGGAGGGVIGGLLGGGGGGGPLTGATPISKTCNSSIMTAMESRAWLEAQREITINQSLIVKPDSVLEYTCFDKMLGVLAEEAENMFSENTSVWKGSVAMVTNKDMDNALTDLVGKSTKEYVDNNFSHKFLGGRSTLDSNIKAKISAIAGSSYTCEHMQKVWDAAKCNNFATDAKDGFLTFQQHADNEVRRYPTACGSDSRWKTNLDAVFKSPGWKTDVSTDMNTTYTNFKDYTASASCDNDRRIQTGIEFYVLGKSKKDSLCLNPGCYYDGSGCKAY